MSENLKICQSCVRMMMNSGMSRRDAEARVREIRTCGAAIQALAVKRRSEPCTNSEHTLYGRATT